MPRLTLFVLSALLLTLSNPAPSHADDVAVQVEVWRSHSSDKVDFGDIEADIESLKAELRRTEDGWEIVVRHKVEVEEAPVGWCDLVLDLVDKDYPSATIRLTVRLDQPVGFDDEEVIYSARTVARIADEHIRDPRRLKLHASVVPAGGGPVLDRESTSVRFKR